MCCLDLKWIFSDFFKRFVTPLEGTLKIELFGKDIELNLLLVGIFTSFLSCLVYSGEGGYHCLRPCKYLLVKTVSNTLFKGLFKKFLVILVFQLQLTDIVAINYLIDNTAAIN